MFRIRQAAKREMQIATTTITTKTTSTKRFGVWTWNDARKTKIARQKTAKRNKRIYKTHKHTHTRGPNTNTNAQAAAESSVRYSNNNNNNNAIKTDDKGISSAAAAGKNSSFICFIHHSIKRTPRRRRHLKHLAVWWVFGYFVMPSLPFVTSVQQCLFFSPCISPLPPFAMSAFKHIWRESVKVKAPWRRLCMTFAGISSVHSGPKASPWQALRLCDCAQWSQLCNLCTLLTLIEEGSR